MIPSVCAACGAPLEEGAAFCIACGGPLSSRAASEPEMNEPVDAVFTEIIPEDGPDEAETARPAVAVADPPGREAYEARPYQREQDYRSDYNPPPSAAPTGDVPPPQGSRYEQISAWGYVGIFFLMLIPGANLLLLILWACGACRKVQKRSFARGVLLFGVLSTVFFSVVCAVLFLIFQPVLVDIAKDAIFEQYGYAAGNEVRTFRDLYRALYPHLYHSVPYSSVSAPRAAEGAAFPLSRAALRPVPPPGGPAGGGAWV